MKQIIPTVKVWCLPGDLDQKELQSLFQAIVKTLIDFPTGIAGEGDVLVLFPKDMMEYGLGTEIKIEITDLPESAGKILSWLATATGQLLQCRFLEANVYCTADCFNPKAGAWSSK